MEIVDYRSALDAGWWIFPLHPIVSGGRCGCGNNDCGAAGKHPKTMAWHTYRELEEDQLAYLEGESDLSGNVNQFLPGYGVNLACGPLLVVDIDARNWGVESVPRLYDLVGLDLDKEAGFVVDSGSGGMSRHLYFRIPESHRGRALRQSLEGVRGIDFKSSGFVVGAGSHHISGNTYDARKGSPATVRDAPLALLELLERPEVHRSVVDGGVMELSHDELVRVVEHIPNAARDYERWIRVGMGLHHATGGADEGYELWESWSARNEAHNPSQMPMKWHSFGKSANPVTAGTLIEWARNEGGYVALVPPPFVPGWDDAGADVGLDTSGVNLSRPPGFVGALADWIDSCCLYPRRQLAVAAALQVVSNCAGLRYRVAGFNTTLNLITLCLADSGTGKGAIIAAIRELHRLVGLSAATVGGIKSEQEIYRNQTRHQAGYYVIDEIGSLLSKISNSRKSGKTAYLEHVVGTILSFFSSGNDVVDISGDLKMELIDNVRREIAKLNKQADDGADVSQALWRAHKELKDVHEGIREPFLSLFGVSEPGVFDAAVNDDEWLLTGGFFGRAVVFFEQEGVPLRRDPATLSSRTPPDPIVSQLVLLYGGAGGERVERMGDVVPLALSREAQEAEQAVYAHWHALGRTEEAEGSGLHPIAIRAPELTLKIAGILGAAAGSISVEDLRWAHALVQRLTMEKLSRAKASRAASAPTPEEHQEGAAEAVWSVLSTAENEVTIGVVANRFRRKYSKKSIELVFEQLLAQGLIEREVRTAKNKRTYDYYRRAK